MKLSKKSGVTLAAAAAAMVMSGSMGIPAAKAEHHEMKCFGVNACKGKTGCATSANSCSGKNGCKGKGWVKVSEKACSAIGGTAKEKK